MVSRSVLVRADTRYETPDEIEVYYEGKWICTAFALDTSRARAVGPENVRDARKRQRSAARSEIINARETLKAVEDQIAKQSTAEPAISGGDRSIPVNPGHTHTDSSPVGSGRPNSATRHQKSAQEDLLSLVRRKSNAAGSEQGE